MQSITPDGVPRIRDFFNSILSDMLFYLRTSYGAEILRVVAYQLNTLFHEFVRTHPNFNKKNVTLLGHSFGSILSYDMLKNTELVRKIQRSRRGGRSSIQKSKPGFTPEGRCNAGKGIASSFFFHSNTVSNLDDDESDSEDDVSGSEATELGKKNIQDIPHLNFKVVNFFAFGSPVSLFLISMKEEVAMFRSKRELLSKCNVYNIYHPHGKEFFFFFFL